MKRSRIIFYTIFFVVLSSVSAIAAVGESTAPAKEKSVGLGAEGVASLSYMFLSKSQMLNMSNVPLLGNVDMDQVLGVHADRVPNLLDMPSIGYVANDGFRLSLLPPLTQRAPFGVSASWRF